MTRSQSGFLSPAIMDHGFSDEVAVFAGVRVCVDPALYGRFRNGRSQKYQNTDAIAIWRASWAAIIKKAGVKPGVIRLITDSTNRN